MSKKAGTSKLALTEAERAEEDRRGMINIKMVPTAYQPVPDNFSEEEEQPENDGSQPDKVGETWDEIEPVDYDSPLSVCASYYLQKRFEDVPDTLKKFNKDIAETLETVARFSPTALPIVKLVNQIDTEGFVMKKMKEDQGKYLDLMKQDKHAQFTVEMMQDHSDPRVVFYLRELAIYYYNGHVKCQRLAEKKMREIYERDNMHAGFRAHNFHTKTSSFEKGTILFYREMELIQRKICKEIFDLLDDDINIDNRAQIVQMMIEWKKDTPFTEPIKGIRNIYFEEYQKIEDTIIKMTHGCHAAFETQMLSRLAIEEDEVHNADNMSPVRAQLFLLHKKVAAIVLVEAQTLWTDFEERIDGILKVQQDIQEAQVETMKMDHQLLQHLVNFAENDQNKYVPEYPLQEFDYQNRNREVFVERTNRKLEEVYEKCKENEAELIGPKEELKQIAFEEAMENHEREVVAHEQEILDAAVLFERLAREIKLHYQLLGVARAEQKIARKAENDRKTRLEAANAVRAAKIAEAKAKKIAKKNNKGKK